MTTDSFLYDGDGNRVEQATTTGSTTATTTYVAGGQEEIANNGSTTTLTTYFPSASGLPTAERVGTGGALTYLATDGQGSVSAALDSVGNVAFQQLYTPYGAVRYSNGSSPTAFGYTGQRADAATGLDYYHARYYDPVAQQFVSADSVNDGLSRYGYVGGNPTTMVDPSGHRYACPENDCGTAPTPPMTPPAGCRATGDCAKGGGGGGGTTPTAGTNAGGNPTPSPFKCDNICVAKRIGDRAGLVFAAIAGLATVLTFLVGVFTAGVSAADPFAIIVGSALTAAIGTMGVVAGVTSAGFFTFDEGAAASPGYFASYRDTVTKAFGIMGVALAAIGSGLSLFSTAVTFGGLQEMGWAWVTNVLRVAPTLGAYSGVGLSLGLFIGAVASLLVLAPLADYYLDQQQRLLEGDQQNCGNNDFSTTVICPGQQAV